MPREEGPGILLLDDVNRADDRILRGIMQLLQNFEMFSWSLPPRWQIVCTANPEGSDYSVTPMDDAMLTRMMHVTLGLDIKAWAAWATTAGVDARGVDFVLTYPEVVTGKRSTPRSLVQVFAHLARIADWKANLSRVATIARSALDDTTVNALLAYVNEGLEHLITAEEILEADPFEGVRRRVAAAARGAGRTVRLDRLSAICMRLVLTLGREAYATPTALHKANVTALLMMEEIPTDLAFSVHRDLLALGGNRAKLISDPALAKRVMQAL